MERRHVLKGLSAIGLSTGLSGPVSALNNPSPLADKVMSYKTLFNQALKTNPALIGFANTEQNFASCQLALEGALPQELQGQLFRNGPGKNQRQDIRYQHLFEGDGMVQRFTLGNGQIHHQGAFIQTPKFAAENKAGRFLYSGPDTKLEQALPVNDQNQVNTANTSLLPVGNDLWALWEAGVPTQIDPDSLEYQQQINLGQNSQYGDALKGLPFSAHPRVTPDGDIWNFGLHPSGQVVLYHLTAKGQVKKVKLINAHYQGGMLHDFLVTHKHILLVLPSLTRSVMNTQQGYFSGIHFDSQQAMRIMVLDKNDFSLRREYELEPGFVFHFGNAWEEPDGTMHFDASLYPDSQVLQKMAHLMKGDMSFASERSRTALFTLYPDGTSHRTVLNTYGEFPKISPERCGIKNDFLYHLSSGKKSLWSDSLCSLEVATGKEDRYHFGQDFLVEEHIPVNPGQKRGKGYLVGTALHIPSQRTCINIFNADNISAGPMTRGWLPYHLPLGFHGTFLPS